MEVETVDDDNDSGSDSEDDISDDDSSDNEIENKGVSNKHPSKEGVSETDKQESKEQQGHFNMCGTRSICGNLLPPHASHRSGLRKPRHVNYTHITVNHVKTTVRHEQYLTVTSTGTARGDQHLSLSMNTSMIPMSQLSQRIDQRPPRRKLGNTSPVNRSSIL